MFTTGDLTIDGIMRDSMQAYLITQGIPPEKINFKVPPPEKKTLKPMPWPPTPENLSSIGKEYNGIVDVGGFKVQVVNGTARFNNEELHVSNNGEMVVNKNNQIVGRISEGQFLPIDASHVERLKQQGLIQEGETSREEAKMKALSPQQTAVPPAQAIATQAASAQPQTLPVMGDQSPMTSAAGYPFTMGGA